MNDDMKELFAVVSDICDSGDYLSLSEPYRNQLYEAFIRARETVTGKDWECELSSSIT